MCVIIQAKQVNYDELANLLENLKDNFDYLIVSDWREIYFVKFDPNHPVIPRSDRGRAFGKESELRWRRNEDEDGFICRWVSDNLKAQLPDAWKSLDQEFESKCVSYLLWGEPLFGDSGWMTEDDNFIWYQTRIPRKLKYPIDSNLSGNWKDSNDKTPLVLKVREYEQNGQIMFERFVGLGRYDSSEQKEKDEEGRK